jgi:hypothetical protein
MAVPEFKETLELAVLLIAIIYMRQKTGFRKFLKKVFVATFLRKVSFRNAHK